MLQQMSPSSKNIFPLYYSFKNKNQDLRTDIAEIFHIDIFCKRYTNICIYACIPTAPPNGFYLDLWRFINLLFLLIDAV